MEWDIKASDIAMAEQHMPIESPEMRPAARGRRWCTVSFWMSGVAVAVAVISVAAVGVLSVTPLAGIPLVSVPLAMIAAFVGVVGMLVGAGRRGLIAAATGITVAIGGWLGLLGLIEWMTS